MENKTQTLIIQTCFSGLEEAVYCNNILLFPYVLNMVMKMMIYE